jgi:hypothetical protein
MPRIPKQEYAAVKNYLCNTLGITRYFIENLVCCQVEKLFTKLIGNKLKSNWFAERIDTILMKLMLEGLKESNHHDPIIDLMWKEERLSLHKYIELQVKRAIKEKIIDSLDIDICVTDKNTVVKKVTNQQETIDGLAQKILEVANYICLHDRPKGIYDPYCDGCPLANLSNSHLFPEKNVCQKSKNFSK